MMFTKARILTEIETKKPWEILLGFVKVVEIGSVSQ